MLSETIRAGESLQSPAELRKKQVSGLKNSDAILGYRNENSLLVSTSNTTHSYLRSRQGGGRVPPERLKDWAVALEMDEKKFAISLMEYYDPFTFDLIFGSKNRIFY